ncbi:DUF4112 domain-containing protein [Methylophaga sulfidovorans]|uniref:DUF4112 domain-containing protein n=1 Tax=Methylophaga sulfidovorans TaxID=45496 RepID=A0A1I4B1Z7_9GAMM|nr:DUF4112 domain-containing protein [Methylophaga sulfidovorans]SFK62888.1 protein of unknown function [Methylophaga sulfidovorans]
MNNRKRFIHRLSWFLDESITLPGGYKIGADGFIGLIPGFGDFIGGLLSSVIIYQAHQIGAPKTILLKMAINMLIDTTLGAIPVIGDVFDFVWKANRRNVALLSEYEQQPRQVYRKTLLENIAIILILVTMIGLAVAFVGWIISLIWTALFQSY